MNKLLKSAICGSLFALITLSSFAAEPGPGQFTHRDRATLPAPLVVSRKSGLDQSEIANYTRLSNQSLPLAHREAAGASRTAKVVLITVGIVLTVLAVAAVVQAQAAGAILSQTG